MRGSIIFIVMVVVPCTVCEYCPNMVSAQIQECVQPVAEYAKVLNGNQDSSRASDFPAAFSLPNMGGKVFNDLCKLIAKFNVCVKEARARCPHHVTITLIDSSYGYLCNEGYNTFMESAECLMELDRKPSVKRCHDETLSEIETANTQVGIALAAKLDRMCGALNFFSGCVRGPIKNDCGSNAWQVIYRVLKDTTNTLMPGCQFTGQSPKLALTSTTTTTTTTSTTTQSPSTSLSRVRGSGNELIEGYEPYPERSTVRPMRKHNSALQNKEEISSAGLASSLTALSLILIIF